jgi:hypothetical protein
MAKKRAASHRPRNRVRRPVSRSKAAVARRTEQAVADFLETGSISGASRRRRVSRGRLRKVILANKIATRDGTGWRFVSREVLVATRGERRWIKVGFEAASLVGSHNEAIKRFRRTNYLKVLAPFVRQVAVDLRGRKHPLETRPNFLHRLAAAGGETFEHVYRLTTGGNAL